MHKFLTSNSSRLVIAGFTLALLSGSLIVVKMHAQESKPAATWTQVTAAEFERFFKANNNWGRWGKDDMLGTINLITDAKRKQAAALVKTGIMVSIGRDISTVLAEDNPSPLKHEFRVGVSPIERRAFGDTFFISPHGPGTTHEDALCHMSYNGRMYNDRPMNTTICIPGIENLKDGIMTRGILIDIPRLKGVPYLEPGTNITSQDVEAWEKMAGVKVSSGDAIILRTGRWPRRDKVGPWKIIGHSSGFDLSMAAWVKSRDVALAGGDNSVEMEWDPPLVEGNPVPLHTFFIVGLGMPIIDSFDPEALAEIAARLHRWEFMLVVAPWRVPNGTASVINPVAVF